MLKKYRYLVALAEERHFGRAAAACNITQPSLSNAIRQMEEELGVAIVERGRSFQGFTHEGMTILQHARHMLQLQADLANRLTPAKDGLHGQLRIGVIPTALPLVAPLLATFGRNHPHLTFTLLSKTADRILRDLQEFALDAGITYLDAGPVLSPGGPALIHRTLFREQYYLLSPKSRFPDNPQTVTWKQAAALPVCLLSKDMLNRQIADEAFRQANVSVNAVVETNSLINLVSLVRKGDWVSIIPASLLDMVSADAHLTAIPLTKPAVGHDIGLIALDRTPASPVVTALLDHIDSK